MHTERVLSCATSSIATPARQTRWVSLLMLAGSLSGLAPMALADDFHTVMGAGVGAVAGAYIGQSIGGRNGAIAGAGAGGLVGASIAQNGHAGQHTVPVQQVVPVYPYQRRYEPYYPMPAPSVVWQAPPPRQHGGWRESHEHGNHFGRNHPVNNHYEQRYAAPVRNYGHDRHNRYDRHDRYERHNRLEPRD